MSTSEHHNKNWIGFKKEKAVLNVSYDKISSILTSQQVLQRTFKPELVIGVARGGIVPASMIATNLSLPLLFISVTRSIEAITWLAAPSDDILDTLTKRKITVLLVDDIISSGETIYKTKQYLENMGFHVITNVVFYDKLSNIIPEIGTCAEQYIKFPWEKKENTFGSIKIKSEKGVNEFHFSDEIDSFGFDLDGIFAVDIDESLYNSHLEYALQLRDELPLLPNFPDIPQSIRSHSAIITGRPDLDYERTRTWLNHHGFTDIPLHCRNHTSFDHSMQGKINSKIKTINNLGISCYFESELIQAVAISLEIPSIDVIWWNNGNPIIVNAHKFNIDLSIYHK